ncbi:hypothetical protein ACFFLM_08005 [Deinococcus oregonensis]|uniref:Uncharacterized protein n=1 Tax=Deinococcus oregonensis TaxID=1805970 RepID=A0ABV6AWM0_9DEIO
MPDLNQNVSALTVLNHLQQVLSLAEAQSQLNISVMTVEFTAVLQKSVGVGTPAWFIFPKDLLGADLTNVDTQRVTFTVKRSQVAPSLRDVSADLQASITLVADTLRALRGLSGQWERSAKIELKFEVTTEGKLSFIARTGVKSVHTHTLTLEVVPGAAN